MTLATSAQLGLPALRFSAGSDAGEECPVGLAGVEQRADAVVGEAPEPEGGALDALDEIVDRLGGAVGDPGAVPVHDRGAPATDCTARAAQLRRTVAVREIVAEYGRQAPHSTAPTTPKSSNPHSAHLIDHCGAPSPDSRHWQTREAPTRAPRDPDHSTYPINHGEPSN